MTMNLMHSAMRCRLDGLAATAAAATAPTSKDCGLRRGCLLSFGLPVGVRVCQCPP